jgi:ribonuclease D
MEEDTSLMINLITNTRSLNDFCASLKNEKFLAVDTEFMREKTYYPQLCLIQVAGEKAAAAIDPLAPDIDLKQLYELLSDPSMLKVFHACRQDMEIFYHAAKSVISPIFDTQIAAMVCGYGESVSYESLVNKTLGIAVDKSSRFTDWSRRPLTDKQLAYAIDDVVHLREVYTALSKQLSATGRTEWIKDEIKPLLNPSIYDVDPDEVWRKLRSRNSSPRYLAYLQAAAKWRELKARERNVPRSRIMKDEIVTEIANAKPKNPAELQTIRGFYMTIPAAAYGSLFAALKEVDSLPSSAYPRLPARPQFSAYVEELVDLLRLLLKRCANDNQIVPRIIADKEELELLASGQRDNLQVLQGWRHEIFGEKAVQLLAGKIALKADKKKGIEFIEA